MSRKINIEEWEEIVRCDMCGKEHINNDYCISGGDGELFIEALDKDKLTNKSIKIRDGLDFCSKECFIIFFIKYLL